MILLFLIFHNNNVILLLNLRGNFMTKIAVILIINRNNEILLQRRFNTGYEDGNYSCIGGHKEENEEILEAAVRETKEEIGINIKKEDLKFLQVLHRKLINRYYIDFVFLVDKWTGEPSIIEKDKSDKLIWCNKDNIPSNIVPFINNILNDYFYGKLASFKSVDWEN